MVLVTLAHPLAQVVNAHNFVTGHDFTAEAVNRALTQSAVLEATEYLGLLGGLTLAAGMIVVMLGASRTGVLPRWMMYLGIFAALLAFTPFGLALGSAQQLIPAFWMVAMGLLLMGRFPGGDPPAWAAGEARPWPSRAQVRTEREGESAGPDAKGAAGRSGAKARAGRRGRQRHGARAGAAGRAGRRQAAAQARLASVAARCPTGGRQPAVRSLACVGRVLEAGVARRRGRLASVWLRRA